MLPIFRMKICPKFKDEILAEMKFKKIDSRIRDSMFFRKFDCRVTRMSEKSPKM
jgi:hypothetical protein